MPFDPDAFDLSRAAKKPQPNAETDERPAAPPPAQRSLCRALLRAIEQALDLEERLPPGRQHVPPDFPIQHAGKPRFNPNLLAQQTLQGWHRLVAIELRLLRCRSSSVINDLLFPKAGR